MIKNYVLDTNVLLHDPHAIHAFTDNHITIPLPVLEELDHFKQNQTELGHNAREVIRTIEKLRLTGSILEGVPLPEGGTLKVSYTTKTLPSEFSANTQLADNRILSVALHIKEQSDSPTILVTKDVNLRIRAEVMGLVAEDYESDQIADKDLAYAGWRKVSVAPEVVTAIYQDEELDLDDIDLNPHEGLLLVDSHNQKHSAICKADKTGKSIKLVKSPKAWDVMGRNLEQHIALALLLDPEVQLVTLVGRAGCGKTLLALSAALEQVMNKKAYKKALVSRPVVPMGRDLGYLPGTVEEKLDPWMKPIHDNLDFLLGENRKSVFEMNYIEVEPLTYIRGRSIPNRYMIIDEAQNLSALEVKTIITRAGVDTKIVFTGDPDQIDCPYLDKHSNGLSHLVSKFKGDPLYGHITLTKGERSELAERASERL